MQQISQLTQIFSFIGAMFILIGYAGSQFKWMSANRPTYNVVNAIGSLILGIIALRPFQLGFVILEFVWVGISVYALWRCFVQKPSA